MKLGKLEQITDLRSVWKHEAKDFTPVSYTHLRVFKARMILYAAYGHCVIREDGNYYEHHQWFELAKDK